MKKNKSSKNWVIQQHRDQYFKQAKSSGFRSRSAYKLLELDKKFKFFSKCKTAIDLGSYPGGWSQVVAKKITSGKILSIDIKDMEPIKNVKFIKRDIFEDSTKEIIKSFFNNKLDVIISDMAADTTGNKSLDSIRTNQLCSEVLDLSSKILKPKGVFVSKLFMGDDFLEVKYLAKSLFEKVSFFKPDSSRNESKETYLHCKVLKTL